MNVYFIYPNGSTFAMGTPANPCRFWGHTGISPAPKIRFELWVHNEGRYICGGERYDNNGPKIYVKLNSWGREHREIH